MPVAERFPYCQRIVRTLSAEELARDVQSLAADDNDLLTAEELLGHDRGQTAKEVTLAINDNLYTHLVSHSPFKIADHRVSGAMRKRTPGQSCFSCSQSSLSENDGSSCLQLSRIPSCSRPRHRRITKGPWRWCFTHNRLESRHRARF